MAITSAREARVRITGDSRQAQTSFRDFEKQVSRTGASIRTMGRVIGGFGALRLGGEVFTETADYGKSLLNVGRALGLTGEEQSSFASEMDKLRDKARALKVDQGQFAAILLAQAGNIRNLRGELSPTQKVVTVMSAAMALAGRTGSDYGTTVQNLVDVMDGYKTPVEDAANITSDLETAWRISGDSIAVVSSRLADLAPAANAAGTPLEDVLAVVATYPAQFDSVIKKALELNQGLKDGDPLAVELGKKVGLSMAEIQEPNLLTTLDKMLEAIANGVIGSEHLETAIGETLSDEEIRLVREYADQWWRVVDASNQLKNNKPTNINETGPSAGEDFVSAWRARYDSRLEEERAGIKTGKTWGELDARAQAIVDATFGGTVEKLLGVLGIPGYASGGYIPATPGGQVIRVAEGGEGEHIVPDSQMRALLGGQSGAGVVFQGGMTAVFPNVRNGGDAREFMRALEAESRRVQTGRRGST
jgi:hypothetical protein